MFLFLGSRSYCVSCYSDLNQFTCLLYGSSAMWRLSPWNLKRVCYVLFLFMARDPFTFYILHFIYRFCSVFTVKKNIVCVAPEHVKAFTIQCENGNTANQTKPRRLCPNASCAWVFVTNWIIIIASETVIDEEKIVWKNCDAKRRRHSKNSNANRLKFVFFFSSRAG